MHTPSLEILIESPLTSVARFGEVVITVVHSELTEEALGAGVAAGQAIAEVYPRGGMGLSVIEVGAKVPNMELRKAASDAMAATKNHTRCTARVFLGDGFWMSTMRSVLTAIELMRPYDIPRRTFHALAPATLWIASQNARDVAWAQQLEAATHRIMRVSASAPSHVA
jgi:hypothetical protein